MEICEVYDMISVIDTNDLDKDIIIEGYKINSLSAKLRELKIKCKFNLSDFRFAEYEYPNIISVSQLFIKIKSNKDRKRFNFHTKEEYVMEKLQENIKILF